MASTLGQLRPGTEPTWRPKKAGIRWGLGFSEHQGRHWAMLGLCWHKLGFRGHLDANPKENLASGKACP